MSAANLDRAYHLWVLAGAQALRCVRCGAFRYGIPRGRNGTPTLNVYIFADWTTITTDLVPACAAWERIAS